MNSITADQADRSQSPLIRPCEAPSPPGEGKKELVLGWSGCSPQTAS